MNPLGRFSRTEADTPPPGEIPGLRGAPMRTPVRTTGATTGPGLWPAVLGRLLTRQIWIELYGLPGYSLTLKGRPAQGFAATPRDFRPAEPAAGKAALDGRFILAGASLEAAAPEDPWNRPSPSRSFATELHAFAWLPSLMLQGERGAREAVRLTLAWGATFARWSPFAWGPEVLTRRTLNLACAARRMGQVATEAERLRLADILGRQGRQLLRPPGGLAGSAERLTAAAVAGCVLAGAPGVSLRRAALHRLAGALDRTVGADGGHASRSPEAGLELLLDLLTLDDALSQLSEASPDAVRAAIQRLTDALRLLTLPDGRLVTMQGGGPSSAARIAAARAHDETPAAELATRIVAGIARIRSPLLTIAADVAGPARGAWSGAACAQPMALEI
ncbi:MAG: heparinase, partial [Alphaproteobacteria bacterium]|nr:heparinase [Alphaproteobacteria bacterium]